MAASTPAFTQASNPDAILNAVRTFNTFIQGREADRNEADRRLKDPSYAVDRDELRRRLAEAIQRECSVGGPLMKQGRDLSSTRAWLFYALGRVANGDPTALDLIERQLKPQNEPDRWVRYWALSGLARSGDQGLERMAKISLSDPESQVKMIGVAALAAAGDEALLREIQSGVQHSDDNIKWPVLRALRIVTVDDEKVVRSMLKIIDEGDNSDITYDAIRAIRHIPTDSRFTRDAARSLATFVEKWRSFSGRDSMRAQALIGLGKLKGEATSPVLIEDLIDYNPAIVREAARSLEVILGTRTAVVRVLESACKSDATRLSAYARALSWMEDRPTVASELAAAMGAQEAKQQEVARALLSEVGGSAAFEKLRAQSNLMLQHTEFIKESEERMQTMFAQSIGDARAGFTLATRMDIAAFVLGMVLIAVSGAVQLVSKGSLEGWIASATSGAAGVLGVLYTLLVAKPRQRVQDAVNHVMHLKIIFLGYLRQLHQADQGYIRRLIENEPMTVKELQDFAAIIETDMNAAAARLRSATVEEPETKAK